MSRLTQTPPLKTISINKIRQVPIHVNEPLLPRKENKRIRQELHLLKQLGQLELLLAKIERLELWKSKGELKSTDTILKDLYENVSRIKIDIDKEPNNMLLIEMIKNEKIYKRTIQFILNQPQLISSSTDGQYQLNHLDQLYVTACRLYQDLNLSNHKYIAYQLALLYQCINRQGVPFITYKGRIEQRFDEIKSATKDLNLARLNTGQISWLQSLTLDIIMQVTDFTSITKCSKLFSLMHQITTHK